MAAFPSFERILIEVHQSLAPNSGSKLKTLQKERFVRLEKGLDGHLKLASKLLSEIFEELGFTEGVIADAIQNLLEEFGFQKALEMQTWTYNADARQIAWHVLGFAVIPGLGRRLAFWNLADRIDRGMPGGRFWFLPQIDRQEDRLQLSMPVTHVVEWLVDLLGQSLHSVEDDTFRKNLYNWRDGSLPDNTSIGAYFPDHLTLEFRGCFVDETEKSVEERLSCAFEFVGKKNLNVDQLRLEIPMTREGLLEAVFEGEASPEDSLRFIELLAERYAPPSCGIIRRRLYMARMIQDGYERLVRFLCPSVDKYCADPLQNKVLQLIWLFEYSYNLTIEAVRHGESHEETDLWFERQLPPWLAHELFVAILPSLRNGGADALGFKLSSRFSKCQGDDPLEDLFLPDAPMSVALMERNTVRLTAELAEDRACIELSKRIRAGSPYRTFQNTERHQAIVAIAHDPDTSPRIRKMAIERLRQLRLDPIESFDAPSAELHLYLSNNPRDRSENAQQRVKELLKEIDSNPAASTFEAIIFQYRAKHLLAMNDFEGAESLFRQAFEASQERAYGPLKGEIARDALALAVAMRPLHANDERYYRSALFYDQFGGISPTFEDAALALSDYFWDDLYQPYAGYEVETSPLRKQVENLLRQPIAFVESGDWESLDTWMNKNASLRNKRVRDVRGDTVITFWLKFVHGLGQSLAQVKALATMNIDGELVRMEEHRRRWYKAIAVVASKWPALLDMADFKGQTPLMLAADHGEPELVQTFLAAGAAPSKQDFLGRTALHAAVTGGCRKSVRLLLDAKVNVSIVSGKEQHTALHTAVRMGNPAIVTDIAEAAPELRNSRNFFEQTPLMLAEHINRDHSAHAEMLRKSNRIAGNASDYKEIEKLLR